MEATIGLEMSQTDESKLADESTRSVQENTSGASKLFWDFLQNELNVEIPTYVKNIMRLCHLDTPISFRCIQNDTIAELEQFARKSMIYQLMGVEVDLQDYYGPLYKMPNKFKFPIGDRFLIKQLVTCAKSKTDDFWKRVLNPNKRTIVATTPITRRTRYSNISNDTRHEQQQHQQQQHQQQEQQDDTSSELELEDEEEKQEGTLDMNRERRKLAETVRSALLKEDYGDGIDPKQVANRVKVRVCVNTSEANGVQRDLVTGFIKCVFCPTRLMTRKQVLGTRKPRWVISNYRRHIRFHMDGKLKRPSAQDFQQTKAEFYAVNADGTARDEDYNDEQNEHSDQIAEMEQEDEEQE